MCCKYQQSLEKKAKAEKLLKELEEAEAAQQPEIDKEGVSEEERYMLRKVGLKMKPFLLLGEFFHSASTDVNIKANAPILVFFL